MLTYRDAPREGAEDDLVSTMEHSVLGRRSIYLGAGDPVAVGCFRRALLGEQPQAVEERSHDGRRVDVREPTVRLTVLPGSPPAVDAVPAIATVLEPRAGVGVGDAAPGADPDSEPGAEPGFATTRDPRLLAAWNDGSAAVADLS